MSYAAPVSTSHAPSSSIRGAHAAALLDALEHDADAVSRLDAIVSDARNALDAFGAQLSLMTDRQITVAVDAPGLLSLCRGSENVFDDTVCATALRTDAPVQVDDASTDARVSSIPAVVAGLMGSYLGAPVRTENLLVGILCVFGTEPRAWTDDDLAALTRLAEAAETELSKMQVPDQRTEG